MPRPSLRRAISRTEIVLTIGIVAVTLGTAVPLWRALSVPTDGEKASGTSSTSSRMAVEEDGGSGTCLDRFTLDDGTIRLTASGSLAAYVLGSEIAYGATTVPVTLSASVDGGPWRPLFGGKALRGRRGAATQADDRTLATLPAGATVEVKVQANDGSTYARSETTVGTRVRLLMNSDRLPGSGGLVGDLGEYARDSHVRIGAHDLLLVTYLNDTNASNADWRHATVLLHVGQSAGACGQEEGSTPRASIGFERLEDRAGQAERRVRVGPAGTPRTDNEWIHLTEEGQPVNDAGMSNGAGVSVQRQGAARTLKVTHAGSGRGTAIADLRVTLAGATIESVEADSAATGDLHDGMTNDGAAGDEAVIAPDRRSVLLMSRAGTGADAFVIRWKAE